MGHSNFCGGLEKHIFETVRNRRSRSFKVVDFGNNENADSLGVIIVLRSNLAIR